MTKFIVFMAAALLVGSAPSVLACASCAAHKAQKAEGSAKAKVAGKKLNANLLCGKCGQVKGADKCCAKNAKVCKKCDFAKGSPACCKLHKTDGKDITLCVKCRAWGKRRRLAWLSSAVNPRLREPPRCEEFCWKDSTPNTTNRCIFTTEPRS